MKRALYFAVLSLALLSCTNKAEQPAEFQLVLESVGGSRARFSVSCTSRDVYYTYRLCSETDYDWWNRPDMDVAREEIARMEESFQFFAKVDVEKDVSFADRFLYRGSRQFTMQTLNDDTDFRFMVFQVSPTTHSIIGEPISVPFHTREIPERDLSFDVKFEGNTMVITPSDDSLTYFWEYESTELVNENYYFASNYAYSLISMYDEYGFMESQLSTGQEIWDFADDSWIKEGDSCTLVVAGCEDGELTTEVKEYRFVYMKDRIFYIEPEEGGYYY